jgi:hypothetical protein
MKKVLTIAGSDSGGGAGIQADLKTFQELEVFGMSALTAVTAQNTLGVQAVFPMTAEAVMKQIESIGEDIGTDALKTGMLFNAEIIKAVSEKKCCGRSRYDRKGRRILAPNRSHFGDETLFVTPSNGHYTKYSRGRDFDGYSDSNG